MTTIPPVSVALPVACAAPTLQRAFHCIAAQDHPQIEIILVLNGADDETTSLARRLAAPDPRARIIELERPSLAAALNVALEAARHDLVARMDADDACPAHRLRLQAERMASDDTLGALGCAWHLADDAGRVITTVHPPTEPAGLRWRLLLGNVLAHGSMMLRRSAVLRVGAYDESLDRAQDYDLWQRLSRQHRIGALADVLYTHTTRSPHDPGRSTREQAFVAAPRMLDAWRELPASASTDLVDAIAASLSRDDGSAADPIERILESEGPTRDALLAWLWSQWNTPPAGRRAYDAARRALLRESGRRLRRRAVKRVWLWGAGDHTRWVLDHLDDLDLEILGLIDDQLVGSTRFGYQVASPDELGPGDTAIISSDWHEDAIWARTAPARARGVRIIRLYAEADATLDRSTSVTPRH